MISAIDDRRAGWLHPEGSPPFGCRGVATPPPLLLALALAVGLSCAHANAGYLQPAQLEKVRAGLEAKLSR